MAVTAARATRCYIVFVNLKRRSSHNDHYNQCLCSARTGDNQTDELTEAELSKVIGGSQSSGAGAGKTSFNPDVASPKLFS